MLRGSAVILACVGLLACSPSRPGYPGSGTGRESPAGDAVRFRIVYVIHGDADYVYHDSAGRRRLADEDAVAQAREVGLGARAAEVFIFHQQPRRRAWLRSAPRGMAYRYRGGRLLEARAYSRTTSRIRGGSDFAAEAALFQASSVTAPGIALGFVYFGHEIPAADGRGYSRSLPGEDFSLARFTRGLERFGGAPGGPEKPFALVVLSTCRGGTPAMTSAIFPYADWVLASPTELHLSFLDTRALIASLAESQRPGDGAPAPRLRLAAAARRMQEESFARLGSSTQAPVALTLYDAEKAAAHLAGILAPQPAGGDPVARGDRMLATAWRDCGEEPGFGPGGAEAGALVLYRAGRFGRLKAKRTHSGWECPQAGAQSAGAREPSGP